MTWQKAATNDVVSVAHSQPAPQRGPQPEEAKLTPAKPTVVLNNHT